MPKIISIAAYCESKPGYFDGERTDDLINEEHLYGLGDDGNLYELDNDTWIKQETRFSEPFSNCCDAKCVASHSTDSRTNFYLCSKCGEHCDVKEWR